MSGMTRPSPGIQEDRVPPAAFRPVAGPSCGTRRVRPMPCEIPNVIRVGPVA
ncbi:hypothetical protein ebA1827 [Aromatoleum aromaticum EbN1]|uniref:Uncharacterized protein n=1 Tax=Aromatoleum aromaticum (strain DSM 19018 / LMG 30748 / EbN1) TaxID=76114 RepID=Q5P6E7_AROAE|nr:hypothetical protein ebA1827 [Aromatoleum aromaticum EbN1]